METNEPKIVKNKTTPQKSLGAKILRVAAGMELAAFTLLALFVLTWFATLEQTVTGIKPMMDKYFDPAKLFFFPEIGRPFHEGVVEPITVWFPMMSGFWLCVIFTLNLILGGLIRFKKTPKKIGILLTHFSIVFLMLGAGVTHFSERRGALQVYEGEVSDAAQDYHQQDIEISELTEGKVSQVHLVDWEHLSDLGEKKGRQRLFRLADLPFDLKVTRFVENAQVLPAKFSPPTGKEKVLDGFWLRKLPGQKETEANLAGCELEILDKNGKKLGETILAVRALEPATIMVEGRPYLLNIRKKLWHLPFKVQLDEFRVERDPGTMRAAAFESDVTRIAGTESEEVLIEMNEPMRREGWTFYQANWGPQDEAEPEEYYSVLEVVHNPSDQWPLYALGISILGLLIHFGLQLYLFISKPRKRAQV